MHHRYTTLLVVVFSALSFAAAGILESLPASAAPKPPPTTRSRTSPTTTTQPAPTTTGPAPTTTSATTTTTTPPTTSAPATPTPVNVAARAAANGRAIVTWKPGSGNPTYQYVIQSREGGQVVAQQAVAGTDTTLAGLSPGHTYAFAVIPSGPQGTGNPGVSNAILAGGAVAPRPVTSLTAGADASTNRVTARRAPPSAEPGPAAYH